MGDMMGNSSKSLIGVIIGIVLVLVGILWYVIDVPLLSSFFESPISFSPFWKVLALLVVGLFGVCIFFIGLIVAWISWDSYQMEKEMESESEMQGETAEEAEEEAEEEEAEEEEAEEEEAEEEEAEKEAPSEKEAALEAELKAEMEKEAGFKCEICGRVLKSKAGLTVHSRTHK